MAWILNITNMPSGSYRSVSGYAAEQAFIARAMGAGFHLFIKAWRDLEYDAVLDADRVLYRVEVKGSSGNSFDFTRGGRSGRQINREVNKTRLICKDDCDFVVGVNLKDFTCYIVPVEIIHIFGRKNLSFTCLEPFKEKWTLFLGGKLSVLEGFDKQLLKSGFCGASQIVIDGCLEALNIQKTIVGDTLKPRGTIGLSLSDPNQIDAVKIWLNL